MHSKILDKYKNLEFGQKLIINVCLLTFLTSIISVMIMLNADNISDVILSDLNKTWSSDFNLIKACFMIIILMIICICTLIF